MKINWLKKTGYIGALSLTLCGGVLAVATYNTSKISADSTEQVISQQTTVSSFNELSEALKDASVHVIKLGGDITFDRSILNIPQRPVTIEGQGHNLTLGTHYISGAVGSKVGILTVKNTNITNMSSTGNGVSKFFTASSENWSINIAGNVNYSGERFLLVQNSVVTFSGKNKVDTGAENAWVRSIVFAPDSEYTSTAASKGQYSGFYFNGNLVNGKATGKVKVDKNAKVNITVSPGSDKNFYYPAFYDKVDRIDVNEGASLNISAAGHALQFIPRADYDEVPSVNIANKAHLNLLSKGGGKYSAISFKQKDTQVNVNEGGSIYIEGNSPTLIETTHDNNSINVTNATYDFRNALPGGKIFKSTLNTRLSLNQVTLNTWGTTGGDYQEDPTNSWDKLSLSTVIKGDTSSSTVSTNPEAQKNFQMGNYGRISGKFEKESNIEAPVLNVVNDKDTQVTGFG
ncbi:pectate lyase-like adhesive domain-containing protein, partial [Lactococcus petauri]|uniref:pectate lyase-like adhesive domain-containing protein n=1 Tax=Lactococcus petauri TaxID=1940789 RepID=UPI0018AC741D